jgi:hypothetical protein
MIHEGSFWFLRIGGLIIYGRSDATLNPGGVRIGTADIYQGVYHMFSPAVAKWKTCSNKQNVVLHPILSFHPFPSGRIHARNFRLHRDRTRH